MAEHKKFDVAFADGKIALSLDLNQDGEKLVEAKLSAAEAIQEAFQRGEEIPDAKLVSFQFVDGKLMLKVDTDKDGEMLLELELSVAEALDEVGIG